MQERIVLSNLGLMHPEDVDSYVATGGFQALSKALKEMNPHDVVAEVKDSGLLGRGGAAFPTGVKWELVMKASGEPKYVVCNGDEGEPGAFKDRRIMEEDPFRIVEAMAIAGYAVGAEEGVAYVRGEYSKAYHRLANAVEQAELKGYMGERILNSDFDFHIELRRGAGGYVCGEETALLESIEGKRGEPRIRPPFPATRGLRGKPTIINNVETLANIPPIVLKGSRWFRGFGTERSPGTKLFCVSGRVKKPGLYELPLGVSLRRLIYDAAGGVQDGARLLAALVGGASGTFVGPEQLDLPLDYHSPTTVGASIGTGAVIVLDESVDRWQALRRIARFFAQESCGICYPCRLGTQRQLEIVSRIAGGGFMAGDVERLTDVASAMKEASICGLGLTASNAILSAIKLWGVP